MNKIITILLISTLLNAEVDMKIENSNFMILDSDNYNYDRLRMRGDYKEGGIFGTVIADVVNFVGSDYIKSNRYKSQQALKSDTPFDIKTSPKAYDNGEIYMKLHRAYIGYADESNRITLGLQNIQVGVGKIWNPTNLFNPRNPYSLEPDEIYPVVALNYTREIDDLSNLSLVVSQKRDKSLKYLGRYKTHLSFGDVAITLLHSNYTELFGYEVEGNLGESGIELRSEGAYIKHTLPSSQEVEFFQSILGADYGFTNGITLALEGIYSSKSFDIPTITANLNSEILPNMLEERAYIGATLSYTFNLYLSGGVSYIESLERHQRFINPSLTYTINDLHTLNIGAITQTGEDSKYYLNYVFSF